MIQAGHLADNLVGFTDLLRRSGLRLGYDHSSLAAQALDQIDLSNQSQTKAALSAALLSHERDKAVFEAAFALFWRETRGSFSAEDTDKGGADEDQDPETTQPSELELPKALEAALRKTKDQRQEQPVQLRQQATQATAQERLGKRDFAALTLEETQEAEAAISHLGTKLKPTNTRRFQTASRGRIDLRKTLNAAPRTAGEIQALVYKKRKKKPKPLVILADISGSMEAYARPALIFAHALAQRSDCQVSTFVFATQLTDITRDLRRKNPDAALKAASIRAQDWSGGTRLGEILKAFNRQHLRRVLSSGGTVLLVTDGLERDEPDMLQAEAKRLAKFSRLWWLNPLMRFDGYKPLARGAAVLELAAERRLSAHSLDSLAHLGEALASQT